MVLGCNFNSDNNFKIKSSSNSSLSGKNNYEKSQKQEASYSGNIRNSLVESKKHITLIETKKGRDKSDSLLSKFKNMDLNNLDNLRIISNLNCAGICNDKKCYLDCKNLQKNAQNRLSKLLSTLHSTYPDKCIIDAENYYEKELSSSNWDKDFLPEKIRSLPKDEIINELAKRCLLVYGITYNDCSLIKKFKFAYPECVELLTLKKRILFLNQWSNKTFSDYLQENNLLLQTQK